MAGAGNQVCEFVGGQVAPHPVRPLGSRVQERNDPENPACFTSTHVAARATSASRQLPDQDIPGYVNQAIGQTAKLSEVMSSPDNFHHVDESDGSVDSADRARTRPILADQCRSDVGRLFAEDDFCTTLKPGCIRWTPSGASRPSPLSYGNGRTSNCSEHKNQGGPGQSERIRETTRTNCFLKRSDCSMTTVI